MLRHEQPLTWAPKLAAPKDFLQCFGWKNKCVRERTCTCLPLPASCPCLLLMLNLRVYRRASRLVGTVEGRATLDELEAP